LKIFKNTVFKILTIHLGVVAAICAVGVRGDPYGAMHHKDHYVRLLHVLLPQHRDGSSGF